MLADGILYFSFSKCSRRVPKGGRLKFRIRKYKVLHRISDLGLVECEFCYSASLILISIIRVRQNGQRQDIINGPSKSKSTNVLTDIVLEFWTYVCLNISVK